MLKTRRKGAVLEVETAVAVIEFDERKGGQITGFVLKDESLNMPMLTQGRILSDLSFKLAGGKILRLSDVKSEIEIRSQETGWLTLHNVAKIREGFECEQEFQIFEEGVLFCEFYVRLRPGHKIEVTDVRLDTLFDVKKANNLRWGYYTRTPYVKHDLTTVHAFFERRLYIKRHEGFQKNQLLPIVSLDLGWSTTRFFSHHIELLLEDWTSYGNGPLGQTRTYTGNDDGNWRVIWCLNKDGKRKITGPYRYRNRWGIMFGVPHTESGVKADPALRNNSLGYRIAHCIYPYVKEEKSWPNNVMPIKQIEEQKPQYFAGFPELKRADEAKAFGTDLFIIHQFWMTNPGSNNEPPADYKPVDPKWLKAFVKRCHQIGLRVLMYIRGTEMYNYYMPFFEDFLTKDYDGLYADWTTPLGMGWAKSSSLHFSAYVYFQFMRALRGRVGKSGYLIGHTGVHTMLTGAIFDACVSGEFTVMHENILESPEACAYFCVTSGAGANLLGGNDNYRKIYATPKINALCACLGIANHPIMEHDKAFSYTAGYMRPLWQLLGKLPRRPAKVFNPSVTSTKAIQSDNENLHPIIYQSPDKTSLMIVGNLSEKATCGSVKIDLNKVGLSRSAKIKEVISDWGSVCRIEDNKIRIDNLPAWGLGAVIIK